MTANLRSTIESGPTVAQTTVTVENPRGSRVTRDFSLSFLTRSSSLAMAGGLVSQGVKFLTVIYVARRFSTAEFGSFSFAVAVNAFIFVIGHFGLPVYGSREVAKTESVSLRLLSSVALGRALLAAVAVAVVLVALRFVPGVTSQEYRLVAWFGLSNICLAGLFDWVFQGLHRQDVSAVLNVLWQFLWLVFIVAGVRLGAGVTVVGVALFASALLTSVTGVLWLGTTNRLDTHDWRLSQMFLDCRKLLNSSGALGTSTLLVTVLVWTDTIVVRLLRGEQGAALYAAGNRAALAMAMLASFYVQGAFPMLSKGSHDSESRFSRYFEHCFRDMAVMFLPVAVWAVVYARDIVLVLFKRAEFLAAVPVFRIFQAVFLLTALANLYGIGALVAFHRDREYRKSLVLVTALFVPLCVAATYYRGTLGAATAALVSQASLALLLCRASSVLVPSTPASILLVPLITGLTVAWIGKLCGLTLFWSAACLGFAYACLFWSRFRVIRREAAAEIA